MRVKKGAYNRVHTARSYCTNDTPHFDYDQFYARIRSTTYAHPHPFLILASHSIVDPGFIVDEIYLISLAILDLLIRYVFSSVEGYCKFNIILTLVDKDGNEIVDSICNAIPLTPLDGNSFFPMSVLFRYIYVAVIKSLEQYKGFFVTNISLRVYLTGKNTEKHLSKDEIIEILDAFFKDLSQDSDSSDNGKQNKDNGKQNKDIGKLLSHVLTDKDRIDVKPPIAQPIENRKRTYNSNISQIKPSFPSHSKQMGLLSPTRKTLGLSDPFLVADIETILMKDDRGIEVQTPYAVGLMVVLPEKSVDKASIMTFFSEDFITKKLYSSFKDRSDKILYEMVKRIDIIVSKQYKTALSIYFHNLSRFDGIILLKHLICHHPYYVIKPLIRNHRIYEIKVFKRRDGDERPRAKRNGVLLFTFKDSLNLLPGKLATLAKNLCPDLGGKYDFDHEQLKTVDDISLREKELLEYLKQDVLVLGGVMKKAQELVLNI